MFLRRYRAPPSQLSNAESATVEEGQPAEVWYYRIREEEKAAVEIGFFFLVDVLAGDLRSPAIAVDCGPAGIPYPAALNSRWG
jgi:hypothetical protein